MKRLKYHTMQKREVGTPEHPMAETYLREELLYANTSNYDVQMLAATKVAYNGEVTVEDVPDVPMPPTVEELAVQQRQTDEAIISLYEAGAQRDEAIITLFEGGKTV